MRSSAEFARTIRGGQRSAGRYLVVHAKRTADPTPAEPARVGFVVSKAVGGAVRRNRVKRRLRAIAVAEPLVDGSLLVVRAKPAAAEATFAELHRDYAELVRRVFSRLGAEVSRG